MNTDWSARLEHAFNKRRVGNEKRNVRFPDGSAECPFSITGDERQATVHLGPGGATLNMQHNVAAFEVWSLALKEVCDVHSVQFDWVLPESESNPHYQRFLYRVSNFASLFPWFTVVDPHRLDRLEIRPGRNLVFNAPGNREGSDEAEVKGEAALERACLNDPEFFAFFGCTGLTDKDKGRQLPVGVFKNSVNSGNAVVPGGKGAIDLYAFKNGCLWLFELKDSTNAPPGTLSEIFFYTCLMRDACRGVIKATHERGHALATASEIRACIVGHAIHPLLDMELSPILGALQRGVDAAWATEGPRVVFQSVALKGPKDGMSFSHPIERAH